MKINYLVAVPFAVLTLLICGMWHLKAKSGSQSGPISFVPPPKLIKLEYQFGEGNDEGALRERKRKLEALKSGGNLDAPLVLATLQEMKDRGASEECMEDFISFLIGMVFLDNGDIKRIYSFDEYVNIIEFLGAGSAKNGYIDLLFERYATEEDLAGLKELLKRTADDARFNKLAYTAVSRFFNTKELSTSNLSAAFDFVQSIEMDDSVRRSIKNSHQLDLQGLFKSTPDAHRAIPLDMIKGYLLEDELWNPIALLYGSRFVEEGDVASLIAASNGYPYGLERFILGSLGSVGTIDFETAVQIRNVIAIDKEGGLFVARELLKKLEASVSKADYEKFVLREFSREELTKLQSNN